MFAPLARNFLARALLINLLFNTLAVLTEPTNWLNRQEELLQRGFEQLEQIDALLANANLTPAQSQALLEQKNSLLANLEAGIKDFKAANSLPSAPTQTPIDDELLGGTINGNELVDDAILNNNNSWIRIPVNQSDDSNSQTVLDLSSLDLAFDQFQNDIKDSVRSFKQDLNNIINSSESTAVPDSAAVSQQRFSSWRSNINGDEQGEEVVVTANKPEGSAMWQVTEQNETINNGKRQRSAKQYVVPAE